MCFALDASVARQKGQLAHIDRNPANSDPDNVVFLCLQHHAEYDTLSKQSKGFEPEELRRYVAMLHEYVASFPWPDAGKVDRVAAKKLRRAQPVGIEVHNLRMPLYRTTIQFLRDVVKSLRPDMQLILQFARDTEEALFLFDDDIADYLTILFKKALHLNTINFIREGPNIPSGEDFRKMVQEQLELSIWFADQYAEIRSRFAPFLRLS